jgi:hypothetical protein
VDFRDGEVETIAKPKSGRPKVRKSDKNIAKVSDLLKKDRR